MVLSAATALMVAAVAIARPTFPWHPKDMEIAIRALGYPRPHPRTLSCKGQGHNTYGRYASWKCHATYAHGKPRTFVMGGEAAGGWLCGGKTLRSCRLLQHGFITNSWAQEEQQFGGFASVASLVSFTYLQSHDGIDDPVGTDTPCPQSGTAAWSCSYNTPSGEITVTISFKKAKGGWITTGSASTS